MSDQQEITVTMLGTEGCGKTVYLSGLYSILSAGLNGYFLHARDPDVDLDLTELWEQIVEDGQLPPPNDVSQSISYPMVFRDGFTTLMNVDWLDYRGGAMSDRQDMVDSRRLTERLAKSDSVYLTIDGAILREGLQQGNLAQVRLRSKAARMTQFLQTATEARGGAPSVVVLITKADLLVELAASPAAAYDQAVEHVEALLPVAFQRGVTSLVCPVSIGAIGSNGSDIDASAVNPRWIHKPLVFSLLCYLETSRELSSAVARDAAAKVPELQEQLVALRASLLGWMRPVRRKELERRIDERRVESDHEGSAAMDIEMRAARLFRELTDQAIFRDGVRMVLDNA